MDVYEILRKHLKPTEYALLAEVRDKAGFSASRSADFIYMNLWPSRGLSLCGIEVKSRRNDWLNELKNPAKAEAIFQYCDFFSLLTTDDTVAKLEEIPLTWGWKTIKGNRVITLKDPPKLTPKPITRDFLAAMLKRATDKTDWLHKDEMAEWKESVKTLAEENCNRNYKHSLETHEKLRARVQAFMDASGIDLNANYGYFDGHSFSADPKKVGEAVRLLMTNADQHMLEKLLQLEVTAKNLHEMISKGVASLKPTQS